MFSEKYIELGFLVDSRNIYGFGERHREFELSPGNYTSWNDGRDNLRDTGSLGNNLYGDHPFVLVRLKDNTFLGIFFRNSNAKTLEYIHVGKDQSVLNFRAIGGIMDFYTFIGDTPEKVLKAYHEVIGRPYFPPFWSLGLHQGSRQYRKDKDLDAALEGHDLAFIPLESIWLDTEYTPDYKNFLVEDKERFKLLRYTSESLHKKGQRMVLAITPGLKADDSYEIYRQAKEQKKLIMSTQFPTKFEGVLIGKGPMGQ